MLDEVHERGLESDFALGLLIGVLRRRNGPGARSPPLRLILMSATIQTEKFVSYLTAHTRPSGATSPVPVPVHHIPGFTYPVSEFFKGDFEYSVRFEAGNEGIRYGGSAKAGSIDYDLLVRYANITDCLIR